MSERDDVFVRDVLAKAGKRRPVPEEPISGIVDAARGVWTRRLRARRFRRAVAWTLPLAAALAIVFVLVRPRRQEETPPQPVAMVVRASGVSFAPGSALLSGAWIDVPHGGNLTLSIGGRSSLRLNGGTRLQLVFADVARLDYGSAYLDCPARGADMTVRTRAGDFAPAGTQFEVRVDRGGEIELRVREGVVTLKRPGRVVSAQAGEHLVLSRDGALRRGEVLPWDASWRWVEHAAPMLDVEGKSLRAFLEWVAREKGWTLRFSDDRAARSSATIILHGSIVKMTLDDALHTIAAGSGFTWRVDDGVLRIEGL